MHPFERTSRVLSVSAGAKGGHVNVLAFFMPMQLTRQFLAIAFALLGSDQPPAPVHLAKNELPRDLSGANKVVGKRS
jgi:hypothetical protein